MPDAEESVFIDTNVLIYATLSDDDRYETARRILLGDGSENVTDAIGPKKYMTKYISVQNLGEMYPNLTGPKMSVPDSPEIARQKIESIASLPDVTVLPLTYDVVQLALELCHQYDRRKQDYFDMQIAAFMKRYRIGLLYTENSKHFTGIAGLRAVNPFEM
jgi:predicted nucleic acid-binding protein